MDLIGLDDILDGIHRLVFKNPPHIGHGFSLNCIVTGKGDCLLSAGCNLVLG